MEQALISEIEAGWSRKCPGLNTSAVATAVRLDVAARLLADVAAQAVGALELDWWEYDVLSALARSAAPQSATALARSSMLSTAAMTNRIDRLEARRLVKRKSDPDDRRRTLVQLTNSGERLIDAASAARFDAAEKALAALTSRQREQLNGLLGKLIDS